MSATRSSSAVRRMVLNAVFVALYFILAMYLTIPLGPLKITLEALPVVLCAVAFGPVDGILVGFLGEFLNQMLTYGFTPTTLLWIAPIVARAAIIGFGVQPLGLRLTASPAGQMKPYILFLILGVFAGVVHSLINTVAYYVDSKMLGYYNYYYVFGMLLIRLAGSALSAVAIGVVVMPLASALKRAKLITSAPVPMTAEESIAYIHSAYWKDSTPGLERTQELLKRIGNPQKKLKFVHIAGTNGKGSTAAMTASILQKAGYKVGLFTSPYIYRFHERMQVNGVQISDKDLAAVANFIKPHASAMAHLPTEFELVTCIGMEYFARQHCDIVVLEVGMGGALDSTNVIECPEVAVITNIGLDHTDYLGDTVEAIARTKAGIFKEGGHAVVYRGSPSVEAVFEEICAQKNVSLKKADFDGLVLRSHGLEGQVFDCGTRQNLTLPLLGDHQLHNASVVLSVVDTLKEIGWKITEKNIRDGLRDTSWPGRFDIVGHDPLFIIDGGHNPQCIDALAVNIRDYLEGRTVIALTGVLADKDYGEMYVPIMPYIQEFVCITPANPRKLEAAELAEHLRRVGAVATPCDTVPEGVKLATEKAGKDGVVLCFGSLYTIGDIRNAL